MKYIKSFENNNDIKFSVNDIVVCSTKHYSGKMDQHGEIDYIEKYPIYTHSYKVKNIYAQDNNYKNVKINDIYNCLVDVEDIKTGELIGHISAAHFTLKTKWKTPNEPMIGDYVLCNSKGLVNPNHSEELDYFLSLNIGKLVKYLNDDYLIEYRNIPEDIGYHFWNNTNPYVYDLGNRIFYFQNIIIFSKDKNTIQEHINLTKDINKYNI